MSYSSLRLQFFLEYTQGLNMRKTLQLILILHLLLNSTSALCQSCQNIILNLMKSKKMAKKTFIRTFNGIYVEFKNGQKKIIFGEPNLKHQNLMQIIKEQLTLNSTEESYSSFLDNIEKIIWAGEAKIKIHQEYFGPELQMQDVATFSMINNTAGLRNHYLYRPFFKDIENENKQMKQAIIEIDPLLLAKRFKYIDYDESLPKKQLHFSKYASTLTFFRHDSSNVLMVPYGMIELNALAELSTSLKYAALNIKEKQLIKKHSLKYISKLSSLQKIIEKENSYDLSFLGPQIAFAKRVLWQVVNITDSPHKSFNDVTYHSLEKIIKINNSISQILSNLPHSEHFVYDLPHRHP